MGCQQREEAVRGLTDKEQDTERQGTKHVLVSNVLFKFELTTILILV